MNENIITYYDDVNREIVIENRSKNLIKKYYIEDEDRWIGDTLHSTLLNQYNNCLHKSDIKEKLFKLLNEYQEKKLSQNNMVQEEGYFGEIIIRKIMQELLTN